MTAPVSVRAYQSFTDTMNRHHASMEIALFAAEIACHEAGGKSPERCKSCKFRQERPDQEWTCPLKALRVLIGPGPGGKAKT